MTTKSEFHSIPRARRTASAFLKGPTHKQIYRICTKFSRWTRVGCQSTGRWDKTSSMSQMPSQRWAEMIHMSPGSCSQTAAPAQVRSPWPRCPQVHQEGVGRRPNLEWRSCRPIWICSFRITLCTKWSQLIVLRQSSRYSGSKTPPEPTRLTALRNVKLRTSSTSTNSQRCRLGRPIWETWKGIWAQSHQSRWTLTFML